jgi:pimeloyl-ACP methyl ester carboxylesterase
MTLHPTDTESISLADHTYFYVGAQYTEHDGKTFSQNAMYVEKFVPRQQTHTTPVVMFHGAGQTGTNYVGTPDGRRGWVHDFLRAGFCVYVVDQPERGRSGHSLRGRHLMQYDVTHIENYFTAPARQSLWPQAQRHTQWPGAGVLGDEVFDQFYAAQVEFLSDRRLSEQLNQQAGVELLRRIGPAVLLTHSQSGPMGWLIADAMPSHVQAILALEPNGPPFFDMKYTGGDPWYQYPAQQPDRPYGLTRAPLTFNPPLRENEYIQAEAQAQTAATNVADGYLQAEPARQLPQLRGMPILIMVAEASYHAPYDHLTSAFLTQAGVDNELVYLSEHGLQGNGHMVMLEKNNHEVADFMINWLQTGPLTSDNT